MEILGTTQPAASFVVNDEEIQIEVTSTGLETSLNNSKIKEGDRESGGSRGWRASFGKKAKEFKEPLGEQKPESNGNFTSFMKRTPTSADAYIGSTKASFTVDSTIEIVGDNSPNKTSVIPKGKTSKADTWLNAQMARIELRYAKLKSTILSWEKSKKTKAKRRFYRKEGELEAKKAKSLIHYHKDVSLIYQVASRAKESAEQKKINEETKLKAKSKKMRSKGKAPETR